VKEQIENNGTIFDKSNYQIRGNMYSITNDEETVLGYFGVNAVTSTQIFVRGGEVGPTFDFNCTPNANTGCIPTPCIDCRQYRPSSSEFKPDFWPN